MSKRKSKPTTEDKSISNESLQTHIIGLLTDNGYEIIPLKSDESTFIGKLIDLDPQAPTKDGTPISIGNLTVRTGFLHSADIHRSRTEKVLKLADEGNDVTPDNNAIYVTWIDIDPNYQGRGLASLLMAYGIITMQIHKIITGGIPYEHIMLEDMSDNAGQIDFNLYAKHGLIYLDASLKEDEDVLRILTLLPRRRIQFLEEENRKWLTGPVEGSQDSSSTVDSPSSSQSSVSTEGSDDYVDEGLNEKGQIVLNDPMMWVLYTDFKLQVEKLLPSLNKKIYTSKQPVYDAIAAAKAGALGGGKKQTKRKKQTRRRRRQTKRKQVKRKKQTRRRQSRKKK